MKILVTGTAGFIGFHLAKKLLERGDTVIGIDNINDYYDPELKFARLAETGISHDAETWNKKIQSIKYPGYSFIRMNLEDKKGLTELFAGEKFDKVCNLAAQAGVRYSLENPDAYISSNIVGFANILEACRHNKIQHLVYASSSSVYGNNKKMPLSTADNVDHPISLYAATKKSNELMAHTYSHLFGLPTTGLRFFTVYGPWGRPDMSPILFAKAIAENQPLKVFNNGNMVRDFTYIDDIVEGVIRVIDSPPVQNSLNAGFSEGGTTEAASLLQHNANSKKADDTVPQNPTEEDMHETSTDKLKARTNPDEIGDSVTSVRSEMKSDGGTPVRTDVHPGGIIPRNQVKGENPRSAVYQGSSQPAAPPARETQEVNVSTAPYKIYNIGNSSPVRLTDYISAIEEAMGKTARKEFLPLQPGDVLRTEADVSALINDLGYRPNTPLKKGIHEFINWYKKHNSLV